MKRMFHPVTLFWLVPTIVLLLAGRYEEALWMLPAVAVSALYGFVGPRPGRHP